MVKITVEIDEALVKRIVGTLMYLDEYTELPNGDYGSPMDNAAVLPKPWFECLEDVERLASNIWSEIPEHIRRTA